METPKTCCICDYVPDWAREMEDYGHLEERKKKGLKNLIVTSKNGREDGLHTHIEHSASVYVHNKCYLKYVHKGNVSAARKRKSFDMETENPPSKHQRGTAEGSSDEFAWETNCFICSKTIQTKGARSTFRQVRCDSVQETIVESLLHPSCTYDTDKIRDILDRLENIDSLVAHRAIYHVKCFSEIRLPVTAQDDKRNVTGRIDEAMSHIYEYIDNHEHTQFSMIELIQSLPDNVHKPGDSTIRRRLQEHYGKDLVLLGNKKSGTIICVSSKGLFDALNESWLRQQGVDDDVADLDLLKRAAELLVKEVRSQNPTAEFYPQGTTMLDNLYEKLPPKIQFFLNSLILNTPGKKEKKANYEKVIGSAAHVLMSAICPRYFLSPLLLSLAVTLHREFGTKNIIEIFHSCGLTASYKETQKYEMCAAKHTEVSLHPGTFMQFVWDNCDNNIKSLHGGSFHVAGEIGIITPSSGVKPQEPIPRNITITAEEMKSLHQIKILTYGLQPYEGLGNIIIDDKNLNVNLKFTEATKITIFWAIHKYLQPQKTLGWNGFIERLTADKGYDTSFIQFFPFIDANPSDYDTLLTAIMKSIEQARDHKMKSCIMTFDQQLYWRARDILAALSLTDDMFVFVRLGGFHTVLSFLGCIGTVMRNSGLHEVFCQIYGESIVNKIMLGKQYARAIRCHTLTAVAIIKKVIDMCKIDTDFRSELDYLGGEFYEVPDTLDELLKSSEFEKSVNIFEKYFKRIEERNSTAKLWLTYCRMVFILKDFVYAEKSGDWDLHLETLEKMIPFFHSTGHFNYAKSAQIYLQDCRDLPNKMDPDEFYKFTKLGYWTSRRVQKFFSGIFTDQTIEQTLMRRCNLKGGLFLRGVTDSVAIQWLMGSIATMDCLTALEKFTQKSIDKNYQHKDSHDSMLSRDIADMKKLDAFFEQFYPFPDVENVTNIVSGISGDNNRVTCHRAFEIGLEIMKEIVGQNYKDLKLSLARKVTSIGGEKALIKVGQEKFGNGDPLILFHRICALNRKENMGYYLTFELAPYPLALFDNAGMRKNTKSKLYSIFKAKSISIKQPTTKYVIDGGMLLHKVKWKQGETFQKICRDYVKYIKDYYGTSSFVVFDGYSTTTTKSSERNRRYVYKNSADVHMSVDSWRSMILGITQEKFLGNNKNKAQLIEFLRMELRDANIESSQSIADADVDIVLKAIDTAAECQGVKIAIVSEDTDVLAILAARAPIELEIFMLKPPIKTSPGTVYSSESLSQKSPCIRENILLLHAFTGCDTTSAFHFQGKVNFCKIFVKNADLEEHAEKFKHTNVALEELIESGLQLALALYGAPYQFRSAQKSASEVVEDWRLIMYTAASQSKKVDLGRIIPTADGLIQHIKRVYCQVQAWYGINLNPLDWGWELYNGELSPVTMTKEAGPPEIMNTISCSCKSDCGNRCGCRRNGLKCSLACKNCIGGNCSNQAVNLEQVDENGDEVDGEEEEEEKDEEEEIEEEQEEQEW